MDELIKRARDEETENQSQEQEGQDNTPSIIQQDSEAEKSVPEDTETVPDEEPVMDDKQDPEPMKDDPDEEALDINTDDGNEQDTQSQPDRDDLSRDVDQQIQSLEDNVKKAMNQEKNETAEERFRKLKKEHRDDVMDEFEDADDNTNGTGISAKSERQALKEKYDSYSDGNILH